MDFSTLLLYTSIFCGLYFQIFLLVTFFEMQAKEQKQKADAQKLVAGTKNQYSESPPTVSIVVPCWNESKTVGNTLISLLNLEYPKNKLSVLVVDDGSKDDTFAVAQKMAAQLNKQEGLERIIVVTQKNGGKYTALNRGIAIAQEKGTQFIGCLDADSFVDKHALIRMIPYFDNAKVMAVTPAMRVHEPKNILQYVQRAEYNVGIFTKRVFSMLNSIYVTPGPFSIFRTSIFKEIGIFKEAHNTEDMEIAFRIQSFGYRIANCHNAFVHTKTPETIPKLHKQRTRWTYGFLKNSIDYKHIFFNKKYGHMGRFVLPAAIVGLFLSLAMAADLIYHIGHSVVQTIQKISIVGVSMPHFTFNWFFVSTQMTTILALVLLSATLTILLFGKKIAEGNMRPSRDMLYFVLFYGFLAPLWLSKAVYNVALSKKTPWR
jgi:cellulose synthase/poly-beta-1,6-N-acetylglucosamine synthase-like glycosyltransferase